MIIFNSCFLYVYQAGYIIYPMISPQYPDKKAMRSGTSSNIGIVQLVLCKKLPEGTLWQTNIAIENGHL